MSPHFIEKLEALTPHQRLHFYELLAHNLTIAIRAICTDTDITDSSKVEQIHLLNEVAHRVTAKIRVLRLATHQWSESDSWQSFVDASKQNPAIKTHLTFAIKQSYDSATTSASSQIGDASKIRHE